MIWPQHAQREVRERRYRALDSNPTSTVLGSSILHLCQLFQVSSCRAPTRPAPASAPADLRLSPLPTAVAAGHRSPHAVRTAWRVLSLARMASESVRNDIDNKESPRESLVGNPAQSEQVALVPKLVDTPVQNGEQHSAMLKWSSLFLLVLQNSSAAPMMPRAHRAFSNVCSLRANPTASPNYNKAMRRSCSSLAPQVQPRGARRGRASDPGTA